MLLDAELLWFGAKKMQSSYFWLIYLVNIDKMGVMNNLQF